MGLNRQSTKNIGRKKFVLVSEARISRKILSPLFIFIYFNPYEKAGKSYKLIIIAFSYPFLCMVSTSIISDYVKFIRHNLKVLDTAAIYVIVFCRSVQTGRTLWRSRRAVCLSEYFISETNERLRLNFVLLSVPKLFYSYLPMKFKQELLTLLKSVLS